MPKVEKYICDSCKEEIPEGKYNWIHYETYKGFHREDSRSRPGCTIVLNPLRATNYYCDWCFDNPGKKKSQRAEEK